MSTSDGGDSGQDGRTIDARSVVTLVVFLIVNILVIFPLRIPLPLALSRSLDRLNAKYRSKSSPAPTGDFQSNPEGLPRHGNSSASASISDRPDTIAIDSTRRADCETRTGATTSPAATQAQAQAQIQARSQPTIRRHVKIGLEAAPVIGVLLLLASTCIPGSVVRAGIVGSDGVRPYDIMTLFLSFAYISISLDCTGLLQYLAYRVGAYASSSSSGGGRTLYFAFYAFFSLTGLLVGNDPLILSGTPFLVYFTQHASLNPAAQTAFFFTHFQASNLVSALLVSSNPTNLVLTSAFGISFLSYSAWLALPTVAAAIVLFPLLRYLVFGGKRNPTKVNAPKVDPKSALVDPWGGIFGAVLFLVVIVLLVVLSALHLLEGVQGVWSITAPAGIIMFIRDCACDVWTRDSRGSTGRDPRDIRSEKLGNERVQDEEGAGDLDTARGVPSPKASRDVAFGTHQAEASTQRPKRDGSASSPIQPLATTIHPSFLRSVRQTFPTAYSVISRLPLPLLPFAFSMFILVEALQYTGWITVFTRWWAAWVAVAGVPGAIWLMATIGVLGCNILGTNIGATVLLSRVLQQWRASHGAQPVSPRVLYGSVFALAVGSNFGAYSFVFSASLAGLLWRNILRQKGLTISPKEFIRWNTVPVVVTMIVGCLVVAGEVCVMYDE